MYPIHGRRPAQRFSEVGWPRPHQESFPPPRLRRDDRLRVVLLDPDVLARRNLRRLLEAEPGFVVVAECDVADEARVEVHGGRPDLLFLDAVLPDADGFALARELTPDLRCGVVFVTAEPQGALEAYDIHALGYLLKPVGEARLHAIASHLRSLLLAEASGAADRLVALLDRRDAERRRRSRLLIRHPDGAFFIRTETIDWLEASGKVVKIHAGKHLHEQRTALAHMERDLDPDRFIRVSRSAIVNLDRVREIQPWFNGELLVILDDDSQVPSSRHYRANLRRLLGKRGEP
jgi:two-component system, LytTR family, response regulator